MGTRVLVVAVGLTGLMGAQSPAAGVSGRVTDQASGRPIPRMVVTAVGTDARKTTQAVTDADGRYEIAGLAAGPYAIGVTHDEHRSTYLPQWFGEAAPAIHATPPRLNITLAAGERRAGVDVALARALAIEGRVLDPWGDPFQGIQVRVLRARDGTAVQSGMTNDIGMYRVFGLAPGRYRVCATPTGDLVSLLDGQVNFATTCHPAAIADADGADVTLAAEDAAGIDIRMQRIGGRSISGTVTDAAGMPADAVYVSAIPYEASGSHRGSLSAGGAFTIRGLAPGRYTVYAERSGDASRQREVGDGDADLSVLEAATVTITLSAAVTVSGTVRFDGVAPRDLQMRIDAAMVRRGRVPSEPSSTFVKSDLSFDLPRLYHRPVFIVAQGVPDGWAVASIHFAGRDITYVPTDFVAAGAGRLDVVLTSRVASPSVRPVDERGDPVPASVVIAIPANPDRWALALMHTGRRVPGSAELKLKALPPGGYIVAALPVDDFDLLMNDESRLAAVASVGTKIALEAGDAPVLRLRVTPLPDK